MKWKEINQSQKIPPHESESVKDMGMAYNDGDRTQIGSRLGFNEKVGLYKSMNRSEKDLVFNVHIAGLTNFGHLCCGAIILFRIIAIS